MAPPLKDAGVLTRAVPEPRHYRISSDQPATLDSLRDLVSARDLFRLLFIREIRVRYQQTVLGLAWVILQPLIPAVVFAVVFGTFARLPSDGSSYLLFALSGMVIYVLFATAASRAGTAFLRDSALVTKVYFPRSLLPLASGASATVDFLVALAVLAVLSLVTDVVPVGAIATLPFVTLAALSLGLSLGLAIAALSARYRDFAIALPFLLQVLLYASPVVYSIELIPAHLRTLYSLNPLVGLTQTFRWAVLGGQAPSAESLVAGAATGLVASLVCIYIYRSQSRDLADVI